MKNNPVTFTFLVFMLVAVLFSRACGEETNYKNQITKLQNWLLLNRDQATGLPHSHVGDERFENWAITYDSAVVICAYIASGRLEEAKKIADFYIQTLNVWRLGGIIEAVNPTNPALGEDWSVRTGSNLWMGIASFHLYKATGELKYLKLAQRLADFAISLQNNNKKDFNFGGIRLGPLGGPNVASDQYINYDINQPAFYNVYATEHNIDAYALFNMLYLKTKETKYKNAYDEVLIWLKKAAYNKLEHRFNRGYAKGKIDTAVATDIHSWAVSALGPKVLDTFEPGFAETLVKFIEKHCLATVSFAKQDGEKVTITGVDFVDYQTVVLLGRKPMVSPEWTFQFVNAYRRSEFDAIQRKDHKTAIAYSVKRQELIKYMLNLAIESNNTLAYPYATEANAAIGHEYQTPVGTNLSAIGVAYAILALSSGDPLMD